MNYGKRGAAKKKKALRSKSKKWSKRFALTFFKAILLLILAVGIIGVCGGLGVVKGILASAPDTDIDVSPSGFSTFVYDAEGNQIAKLDAEGSNRVPVSMDKIPENLAHAFVAIEDARFYEHNGIDIKGIIRAGFIGLTSGHFSEGASTITQQLIKNNVLTSWTSESEKGFAVKVKRKIQEQYLAIMLEKQMDKDKILENYMNTINLGQNTLGVESASLRYFGKHCSELTISECAVIASITQNPSKYNPIRHPEENVKRRKKCLNKMLELGFISQTQYDEAMADTDAVYERIGLYDIDYQEANATTGSYFSDAVYEQVKQDLILSGYNENMAETLLTSGGLRVESTLDPKIQAILNEEYADPSNYPENVKWYLNYALTIISPDGTKNNFSKENMMTWFKQNQNSKFNLIFSSQDDAYAAVDTYRSAMLAQLGVEDDADNYEETISMTPQPQSAMVIEEQNTGYVVAMIGGRGAKEGRRTLNRATSAKRLPGSTFKVVASYAPALDSAGKTLATVYNDAPFNYADGTPVRNWYKTGYRGIQNIRSAIRDSLNIIAVKNITVITPRLGYDYLLNFGFTTLTDGVQVGNEIKSDVNQSLALGGLTYGVTPYELTGAYAAIANGGTYVTPKLYTRVTDSDGNVILDNTNPATRQVIKETTAFLLTSAMQDVVTSGTGGRVNFGGMAIAGKTGTTTGPTDAWFVGYTPYYTAATWTGYDNNVDLNSAEDGVSKTLWRKVMKRVHEDLPNTQFPVPSGIVQVAVCSQSGKLPIPGLCDGSVYTEYFAEGTEPTESCDVHYQGEICAYDGLPASPDCPFKYTGVATMPLVEDPALQQGSTVIINNPDGTQTVSTPNTRSQCQHDATFFANPDYESVINQQQAEINARNAAAQPQTEE